MRELRAPRTLLGLLAGAALGLAGGQRLPAVAAGQVTPWRMEEGVSWNLFADHVEGLAGALERARVLG